jgi:hypothetical protein
MGMVKGERNKMKGVYEYCRSCGKYSIKYDLSYYDIGEEKDLPFCGDECNQKWWDEKEETN